MNNKLQSFEKRNKLLEIEMEVKKYWEENIAIEPEIDYDREKFMVTFPYPYMNGKMHLGHAFSLSKAEFTARFQKMLGKNVLFPFSFHCTGMPIAACADKLKYEIENFGNPPQFPIEDINNNKNLKSKMEMKHGKEKYQWNILKNMGIDEKIIPNFADADFWLEYFPKEAIKDLKNFGLMIDWRRSFITTKKNPYYDSFIKWQFRKLIKNNKLKFGKRYVIYSLKDNGPCADHDRKVGEGVEPQSYTVIKLKVVKPYPSIFEGINKDIFIVTATLRPETMYGQTNYWVDPNMNYGIFEFNSNEIIICSDFAALNLSCQDYKVNKVGNVKGDQLIGVPVEAPLTKYPIIYGLPFPYIDPDKGTGIVTSVPSDSPHDYIAYLNVTKNSEYQIDNKWILDIIPFIEVPGYGNLIAKKVCDDLKVSSIKDTKKLEKAHDIVYSKGYYKGKFLIDKFQGKSISEVKDQIKNELIENNQAFILYQPAETVISRSDDKCVVSLTDQWFINYGDQKWKKSTLLTADSINTFSPSLKKALLETVNWLNEWPCSRSYGLGTNIPGDEKSLIDSLSDSTIYMAYYTISHLLQGNLEGSTSGILNIKSNTITDSIWDSIFVDNGIKTNKFNISSIDIMKLKHEYLYWYPIDLRVSGKDLINNHLGMCLYNHNEILGELNTPKSFYVNGHLQLNGTKMSKSTGNFLTLEESINKYSSDVTRIILGLAGDDMSDANFEEKEANAMILKLTSMIEWYQKTNDELDDYIDDDFNYFDNVFNYSMNRLINKTIDAYKNMRFREGLIYSFFDMQNCKDKYIYKNTQINKLLIMKYMKMQLLLLAPIIPHVTQYLWAEMYDDPIMLQGFPQYMDEDEGILQSYEYLEDCIVNLRKRLSKKKSSEISIYVSDGYKNWQKQIIELISNNYDYLTNTLDMNKFKNLIYGDLLNLKLKDTMSFANYIVNNFKKSNQKRIKSDLPFSEIEILEANKEYIMEILKISNLNVKIDNDLSTPFNPRIKLN